VIHITAKVMASVNQSIFRNSGGTRTGAGGGGGTGGDTGSGGAAGTGGDTEASTDGGVNDAGGSDASCVSTPVTVATASAGSSPGSANGYIALSSTPLALGDDNLVLVTGLPSFVYAGQTYTSLGVGSNGCLVVGGCVSGVDCLSANQSLPDPNSPNQLLAPFWTDLDPSAGGAVRVDQRTINGSTWIVVDWNAVPEYGTPAVTDQFEVWIGTNGIQDISFSYGNINGTGRNGNLTIGAENGCQGQNYYFKYFADVGGATTVPGLGTELGVTSP